MYPGLDLSDSEDNQRALEPDLKDEAWNPKGKLMSFVEVD